MNDLAALKREVEQLRKKVEQTDEWATGVFEVLMDLLPPLLREHPEIAAQLEPRWQEAAERFARMAPAPTTPGRMRPTADRLEAKKMLYGVLRLLEIWPARG